MKLKAIAVLYTILLLACALVLWFRIEAKTEFQLDMLDLNTRADSVSAALSEGADRDALEAEYRCEIILVSDSDYATMNNEFIKHGWSVFDYRQDGQILGKVAFDARGEEYRQTVIKEKTQLITVFGSAYAAGIVLLIVIWYFYIRPFNKLKVFAENVSRGNLDVPLEMTKHNYFGAFTESFDRM